MESPDPNSVPATNNITFLWCSLGMQFMLNLKIAVV